MDRNVFVPGSHCLRKRANETRSGKPGISHRHHRHFEQAPKASFSLPTQEVNDNGRDRQLRRDRNLPCFSSLSHLQNTRSLGRSARTSRVGMEFDPLRKGRLGLLM
jgi:hypothetical protein